MIGNDDERCPKEVSTQAFDFFIDCWCFCRSLRIIHSNSMRPVDIRMTWSIMFSPGLSWLIWQINLLPGQIAYSVKMNQMEEKIQDSALFSSLLKHLSEIVSNKRSIDFLKADWQKWRWLLQNNWNNRNFKRIPWRTNTNRRWQPLGVGWDWSRIGQRWKHIYGSWWQQLNEQICINKNRLRHTRGYEPFRHAGMI